jgi:hypothetical protein
VKEKVKRKREESLRVAQTLALTSAAVQQELEKRKTQTESTVAPVQAASPAQAASPVHAASPAQAAVAVRASPGTNPTGRSKRTLDEAVSAENMSTRGDRTKRRKAADDDVDPRSFVNRRYAKYFGKTVFFGTIVKYDAPKEPGDAPLWHGLYDDNDKEVFEEDVLGQLFELYTKPAIIAKDKHPQGFDRSGAS